MKIDILKTLGIKKPLEREFNKKRDEVVTVLDEALADFKDFAGTPPYNKLYDLREQVKGWRL